MLSEVGRCGWGWEPWDTYRAQGSLPPHISSCSCEILSGNNGLKYEPPFTQGRWCGGAAPEGLQVSVEQLRSQVSARKQSSLPQSAALPAPSSEGAWEDTAMWAPTVASERTETVFSPQARSTCSVRRIFRISQGRLSLKKAPLSIDKGAFFWRRRRDSNSRAGHPTYSLSRGAPSPLGYFSTVNINL